MDQHRLRELITAAAGEDRCPRDLLGAMQNIVSIETGEVSRNSLIHTYRRRLARTADGSPLQTETAALVSFLESYSGDTLNMVSVKLEGGGYQMFLTDPYLAKILYWMRMFSR
ncbi:hypothetical protein OG453_27630 [Streptomyces sp. NBC_01381]|uniref:hypothetical protein n=1 Tax=Streptomyces sp. NBC_01381 TaxID=2903845 RepID=UPI0022560127|nr:hypothetical protein [Streptomyces sp. NBC_01381]MCX4670419.1 hypothetical protein [Streptomyces sp. NBC_01381]